MACDTSPPLSPPLGGRSLREAQGRLDKCSASGAKPALLGGEQVDDAILATGSAELKGPRTFLRIQQEIFDFESDLGLKLGQTQPPKSGTVPTNRHTTIPNDSGPISVCFDDDPKLVNCEVAQPSWPRASP